MNAVFVGSFDPFTEGHKSIVDRVLPLFDKIIIGVGVNPDKHYMFTADDRVAMIRDRFADVGQVQVEIYEDYTIDFARRHGASYIIKGVRNVVDFEYEQFQADWNREHGNIETLFVPSTPELREVSSTSVRKKFKELNNDNI